MTRSGFFAVPVATGTPARDYRAILDLAAHVDDLGFDSFWVAEGRIATNGLPDALAFLAAAAQRTTRVALGTAVVTLAFEEPVALAETAAVVDALSGGRLELGVGKSNPGGWSSRAFAALALDEGDRDALFSGALDRLREALTGEPGLYPKTAHLAARVWQATGSVATAASAGSAGDGLLLHRKAPAGDTGAVQAVLVDAYLDALPASSTPRIAASRVVLPARDARDAVALLTAQLAARPEYYARAAGVTDVEAYLVESNIAFGSPADIVDALRADAAASRSTEVLFSIPLPFDAPEYRDALTTVAREIAPRLAPVAV